jgi:hypothetical protein
MPENSNVADLYELVRREWGATVAAAAGDDTSRLEAALTLLRTVENGLVATRPATNGASPGAGRS